jgi:hypothetical protein
MACAALVASVVAGQVGGSKKIKVQSLIRETQKTSDRTDEMTIVWWIPEQFWASSFAQAPGMTPAQAEACLKVIRQYAMVAVVDGKIGPFAGITFKSEAQIRASTRILDSQNKAYAPLTEDEVDADTRNMLQMLKPMLARMLGPVGQNMHFLLFPAKTKAGVPIADPKSKGHFRVRLGQRDFRWRLPLDALLPARTCTGCKEECKGSWNFCPWCGGKLGRKGKTSSDASAGQAG